MTTESNIASIEGLSFKRALNLAALPLLSYSEKNIKFFIDMPIVSMPPDAYLSFLPVKTQNFLMAKTHFNIFLLDHGTFYAALRDAESAQHSDEVEPE